MQNSLFKNKIILLIVALAGVFRISYLTFEDQVPVMWDARIYSSAAIGLLYYAENSDRFGHPEDLNGADSVFYRAQYDHATQKYIDGEQVDWLYYDVPNIRQAQDNLFISGPIYPAFLATVFAISPAEDFLTVRIINLIIDLICLWLVMLIADKLFKRRVAIIAGLLYALYFPFVLFAGMISPEPLTLLFTLLLLYLLVGYRINDHIYKLLGVGFLAALLVLNRSTATLLFVPLLFGFLYDQREHFGLAIKRISIAALPFGLLMVSWLMITYNYYDQLTVRDPGYSEANFRSSSSVKYEGYDLDYTEQDFWTAPVAEAIFDDLPGYAGLLAKKLVRLWGEPYNDFKKTFGIGLKSVTVFHLGIILIALFTIFGFWKKSEKGRIYLVMIPLYYTALHLVFHSLARYNLNAMPAMIIIGSFGISLIIDRYYSIARSKIMMEFAAIAIGYGLVLFLPEHLLVSLLGSGFGSALYVLLKLLIVLGMLALVFIRYRKSFGLLGKSIRIGLPGLVLILPMFLLGSSEAGRLEYKTSLDGANKVAGTMIYMPRGFRLKPGELVRICIDMTTSKDMTNPVNLYINGERLGIHFNRPPYDIYYSKKMTYQVFDREIGFGKEQMRSWRYIPLNPELFNQMLEKHGLIDIAISRADSVYEPDSFIELYGTYLDDDDSLELPSITQTSVERFVEKGDPRIYLKYKISSDSAVSYYIENMNSADIEKDDLSPAIGLQDGRYRIFLEVKRLNFRRLYF